MTTGETGSGVEGGGSLPKVLIGGTVLFAVAAAAAVAALVYFGQARSEADSQSSFERRSINITQEELSRRDGSEGQ